MCNKFWLTETWWYIWMCFFIMNKCLQEFHLARLLNMKLYILILYVSKFLLSVSEIQITKYIFEDYCCCWVQASGRRWVLTLESSLVKLRLPEPWKGLHLSSWGWCRDYPTEPGPKYHLHSNCVAELSFPLQIHTPVENAIPELKIDKLDICWETWRSLNCRVVSLLIGCNTKRCPRSWPVSW